MLFFPLNRLSACENKRESKHSHAKRWLSKRQKQSGFVEVVLPEIPHNISLPELSLSPSPRSGRPNTAKAPVAGVKGLEGSEQVLPSEIGPQRGREMQFGIRTFPQQKIAQALFAARANQ